MIIKIGNNQRSLLKSLLFDYMCSNEKQAKTNKIVRREYLITKGLYERLTGKRKICPKCGQRLIGR